MDRAQPDPGLGINIALERLYRQLSGADGSGVDDVAAMLAIPVEEFLGQVRPLVELGVVNLTDGKVAVASPATALSIVLAREAKQAADSINRLARLANAVPYIGEPTPPGQGSGTTLDAFVIQGPAPLDLVEGWIRESSGELMVLRPDQWRMPTEPAMAAAYKEALGQGRRARCIYPVRALHEARSVLADRAAAGEEIRLLPEVPSRMLIVGRSRAMVPDTPGVSNLRAVVLRDVGVVAMMRNYFEELWDRAVAFPGVETGDLDERGLLLAALVDGARDEQIAQSLGIGLRTVRRRVASLLIELGAETRFQAGVEAVRRGWL